MQQRDRARSGVSDVKSADDAIHACGCYYVIAVLVPVVSQGFGGRESMSVSADGGDWGMGGRAVDWDRGDEVVGGAGGGAEVEDSELRVGGYRGDYGWGMR